ncbi:hypothetical protein QFZ32_000322 [Streptomyces canus]|nr:hypothetical protein [Streptomyces canus]MDQ1064883.1 hypothetical protein [Streptomyces canus]
MLLDPPGGRGAPQGLPHRPYVKAVDGALTTRGIPPGTVRASHHSLEHGPTTYMILAWDVSRTAGHGGIRLLWEERQGWYYALLGLHRWPTSSRNWCVTGSCLAGVLDGVGGAREIRAAAAEFRRSRVGLASV